VCVSGADVDRRGLVEGREPVKSETSISASSATGPPRRKVAMAIEAGSPRPLRTSRQWLSRSGRLVSPSSWPPKEVQPGCRLRARRHRLSRRVLQHIAEDARSAIAAMHSASPVRTRPARRGRNRRDGHGAGDLPGCRQVGVPRLVPFFLHRTGGFDGRRLFRSLQGTLALLRS
jgi:hypothetical protein